jgi:AraC-like DNA-binding protein
MPPSFRNTPQERVRYGRLPFLGGVELLDASYVAQRFGKHYHEGYALGCVTSGGLAFRSRGANRLAGPGQINLTSPGDAHDGHAALPEGWSYRMLYLAPQALAAVTSRPDKQDRSCDIRFRSDVLDDPALARRILRAHRVLFDPNATLLGKETLLLDLLRAWVERHGIERPAPAPEHGPPASVRLARELIEARFDEDLSLAELSRVAGLSPYHFIRVFEKQTGLTPHLHLINTRLAAAKQALDQDGRLADIAAQTGFSDQAHLTRLFKQRYGITPAAYRNFLQNPLAE